MSQEVGAANFPIEYIIIIMIMKTQGNKDDQVPKENDKQTQEAIGINQTRTEGRNEDVVVFCDTLIGF